MRMTESCRSSSLPITKAVLLLAGLAVFTLRVEASPILPSVPLPPGGSAPPPLTFAPPGTLEASLLAPFSFTTTAGTTSGDVLSAVFLNPTGTLDFYYQVVNNANSATSLARESDVNFLGFLTSAAYRVDGGSLPGGIFTNGFSSIFPVSADRDVTATTVGFNFISLQISPGATSVVFIISTNAITFTAGDAEVIGGGAATVASFQPLAAAAVPEPASVALMGAGLIALAGIRRLRFGR